MNGILSTIDSYYQAYRSMYLFSVRCNSCISAFNKAKIVLDVGTGAGVSGVVLAIAAYKVLFK